MNTIKVEKKEHPIWTEGGHKVIGHKIVGQWHYIYSLDNKTVSMITIYGYPLGDTNMDSFQWEIYGHGLEDIERFNTKDEAEARVWELLLTPRGSEMP